MHSTVCCGPAWTKPSDIKKSHHTIYYVTTQTFDSFTDAKPLFPSKASGGVSMIDATMAPFLATDKAFFLVYKNEVNKTIGVASAPSPEGPYSTVAHNIAPAAGSIEGPSVVRRSRDEVIIYFDRYEAGKYGAVRASSMRARVWEDISSQLTLPAGVRHATVLRVPKAMVQRLRAAFGTRDRGAWRPEGVLA